MKLNFLNIPFSIALGALVLTSCSDSSKPPLQYFPDMYYPVAYDPLQKAEDPYSKHENEIPAFIAQEGATALKAVAGTVSRNTDGILAEDKLPSNPDEYNAGYEASKSITASPLFDGNKEKDIERGKKMYEYTCAACHGSAGDGQGPIVQSGAYSGVPNYADRELTVGSVHYVLTHGRNAMGSYAGQLTPGDRWRVAMYVMSAFKAGNTAQPAGAPEDNNNQAEADATANTTNDLK